MFVQPTGRAWPLAAAGLPGVQRVGGVAHRLDGIVGVEQIDVVAVVPAEVLPQQVEPQGSRQKNRNDLIPRKRRHDGLLPHQATLAPRRCWPLASGVRSGCDGSGVSGPSCRMPVHPSCLRPGPPRSSTYATRAS